MSKLSKCKITFKIVYYLNNILILIAISFNWQFNFNNFFLFKENQTQLIFYNKTNTMLLKSLILLINSVQLS